MNDLSEWEYDYSFYEDWSTGTSCEYCHKRIKRAQDKQIPVIGDDLFNLGARLCSMTCLEKFLLTTVKSMQCEIMAPYHNQDRCRDKRGRYVCPTCHFKVAYGVVLQQAGFTSARPGCYCSYECLISVVLPASELSSA